MFRSWKRIDFDISPYPKLFWVAVLHPVTTTPRMPLVYTLYLVYVHDQVSLPD